MLVNLYLHGMIEEYHIVLKNLFLSSFLKLMEVVCCTNELVRPSFTGASSSNSSLRKRSLIATFRNGEGSRSLNLKKTIHDRRGPRQFPTLSPLPCDIKKAAILLDKWDND